MASASGPSPRPPPARRRRRQPRDVARRPWQRRPSLEHPGAAGDVLTVDNTNLHTESESEDSLSSPHEELPGLSASKALAASLSSRRGHTPPGECAGSGNASFRDGLLRVSGIDAGGGLDLQGLLLSSLRENFAQAQNQVAETLGKAMEEPPDPAPTEPRIPAGEPAEPRRARKRR